MNNFNQDSTTDIHHNPTYNDGEVSVIVDLEECARLGQRPPRTTKGYQIRINGDLFVVLAATITGRQILEIAGLKPAENYTLRVKSVGKPVRKIDLDEKIDLTELGIEKFKALPRDQTEGSE